MAGWACKTCLPPPPPPVAVKQQQQQPAEGKHEEDNNNNNNNNNTNNNHNSDNVWTASMNGDMEKLKSLLAFGLDVNAKDPAGI